MRVPSLQLLHLFAERLQVPVEYLAMGTQPRPTPLLEAEIALRLDDVDGARALYEQVLPEEAFASDALVGLGQIALREGRHRAAIELLEEAFAKAGHAPADALDWAEPLARAYAAVGEFAPAIALLRECVERLSDGDLLQYIRFAALLGYALTDSGDYAGAQSVIADALSRGRTATDPYARARLYWSQSRVLAEQGDAAAAERYARKTLETLRATEDSYAVAHALETLAHICLDLGRPEEALELLEEGEPVMKTAGTPNELARYRVEQARAFAALGRREEAAALAMEAAGGLVDVQPMNAGRAYLLLGEIFDDIGETERARELWELAIERGESQPPTKHLVAAYRRLADLSKREGRPDEALALLERALSAQSTVLAP